MTSRKRKNVDDLGLEQHVKLPGKKPKEGDAMRNEQSANDLQSEEVDTTKNDQSANDLQSEEVDAIKSEQSANDLQSEEVDAIKSEQSANDLQSEEVDTTKNDQSANDLQSEEVDAMKNEQSANDLQSEEVDAIKSEQSANDLQSEEVDAIKSEQSANDLQSEEVDAIKNEQSANDQSEEVDTIKNELSEDVLENEICVKEEPQDFDMYEPHVEITEQQDEIEDQLNSAEFTKSISEHQLNGNSVWCKTCDQCFTNKDEHDSHLFFEEYIYCKFCDKEYNMLSTIVRHTKQVHGDLYACPKCKEYFWTEKERDEHSQNCWICRRSDKIANFQCNHCHRYYMTKKGLMSHIIEDHSNILISQPANNNLTSNEHNYTLTRKIDTKYYENLLQSQVFYDSMKSKVDSNQQYNFVVFCIRCRKDFPYQQFFAEHLDMCYQSAKFYCPFCNIQKRFIRGDVNEHIKRDLTLAVSTSISSCENCKLNFFNCINLFKHKSEHVVESNTTQASSVANTINDIGVKNQIPYSVIMEDEGTHTQISQTELKNDENIYYVCKYCSEHVPRAEYIEHLDLHVYKCPFCTRLVPSKESIISHCGLEKNASTEIYEYVIEKELIRDGALKKRKVYLVDPPVGFDIIPENKCHVCKTPFQFHCQLVHHQRKMHHDINLIQCATCQERFCSKFLFECHVVLHAEERVRCQQCKIILQNVDSFFSHLDMVHSEKLTLGIECCYCYDIKLNEEKLEKHNIKYHQDMTFLCRLCGVSCDTLAKLDQHRMAKHDLSKFKCKFCKAQFSKKCFLNQHDSTCAFGRFKGCHTSNSIRRF